MMYIIIAEYHPLHEKGDTMENYLKKITQPHWTFPPHFSQLARSLFVKMVKTNSLDRYSAKEALSHPWITRTACEIPLSYTESITYNQG